MALTYGSEADWVRVLAGSGCELATRSRRVRLGDPELVRDDQRRLVPTAVRPALRVLGVTGFLRLRKVA